MTGSDDTNKPSQAEETGESLRLKWGTLKGWQFNEGGKAFELLKKYMELGSSLSAAMQHDTPEQKQLLLDMIDAVNCDKIYLDWDNKYVSKEEAKQYVTTYGQDRKASTDATLADK